MIYLCLFKVVLIFRVLLSRSETEKEVMDDVIAQYLSSIFFSFHGLLPEIQFYTNTS